VGVRALSAETYDDDFLRRELIGAGRTCMSSDPTGSAIAAIWLARAAVRSGSSELTIRGPSTSTTPMIRASGDSREETEEARSIWGRFTPPCYWRSVERPE